jgi:Holliday junction resolvasome RuvABC endonuclease subunit
MVSLKNLNPVPNKICSIDASTNSLAFAIFEKSKLVEFGKINFSGKDTYKKVSDSIKKTKAFFEQQKDIDAILIEHTIYLNSAKTAADLALVQGAILGGISLNNIKTIKSINPIAWQTFLGNARLGGAEKELIRYDNPGKSDSWYKNQEREFRKKRTMDLIKSIYSKTVTDNDVADAIGVGHYAIHNWHKLA